MSNAAKYTNRDGKILIHAELISLSKVKVSITDTGKGIKKKDQDKIFKIFGNVIGKNEINTNGIGLGLVISKMIAQDFGGDVDFFSEYKQGSTFFFTFRLDNGGSFSSEEAKRRASGIPIMDSKQDFFAGSMIDLYSRYGKNRIMVVDDEEFCISALRSMLVKQGINQWQVDYCFDGLEAVRCVKKAYKTGMRYSIIFMDFNMPNLNGIEATKQILEYLPDES